MRLLLLSLLLFGISSPSAAQNSATRASSPENTNSPENTSSVEIDGLDEAVNRLIEENKIAGAVILVLHRDQIVFSGSYGKQTLLPAKAMRRDSIFRIYSMSKAITAAAAMTLVESGKLKLDAPVSDYLPEMKEVQVYDSGPRGEMKTVAVEKPITVLDLLRHTSGLTYGVFGKTEVDKEYVQQGILAAHVPLAEMTKKLARIPLLHQPQSNFHYGVSSDVLGRVIEVASNQSFDDYLRETIFEPLKMNETGFFAPEKDHDRLSGVYSLFSGSLIDASAFGPQSFMSEPALFSGGGGLVSTADDYMRFCRMLLNEGTLDGHRVLSEESVRAMTSNQLTDEMLPMNLMGNDLHGVGFGMGLRVNLNAEHNYFMRSGEYGWDGAASTHYWVSPKDDLAVVAMSQLMPFTSRLAREVKPLVYRWLDRKLKKSPVQRSEK